jgi:hypothetical protein
MIRFLLFLLFLNSFSWAEELETRKHQLQPFTVDLLLHWDDMKNFPFDKHFIWSDNAENFGKYFMLATMSKRLAKTNSIELESKIKKTCHLLSYQATAKDIDITAYIYNSQKSLRRVDKGSAASYQLKLTAPARIHRFIENMNSYLKGEIGIEIPQVNVRMTAMSLPVEVVRQYGLDFFPTLNSQQSLVMPNPKFAQFITEISQQKGCFKLTEMVVPAISGNTFYGRNSSEMTFPEAYDFTGEMTPTISYNEKGEIIKGSSLLKASGIETQFGEPRDVGVILEVTQNVEPDGKRVTLDIRTEISSLLGWTHYDDKDFIKMPALKAQTIETRFLGLLGSTFTLACMYNKSINKSAKHVLTNKEHEQLATEQCIVYFMSIEDAVTSQPSSIAQDEVALLMIPTGDRCNKQLIKLFGGEKDISADIKSLLAAQGVNFHPKGLFYYDTKQSVLFMTNSPKEIAKTKKLLKIVKSKDLNLVWSDAADIRYSFMQLELPEAYATKYKIQPGKQFIRTKTLDDLFKDISLDQDASITDIGSSLTQNGNTCIIRNVLEIYYPEYYELQKIDGEAINLPFFGDPSDIGGIYELTPQIDPNFTEIEVRIQPQAVTAEGWQKYQGMKGMPLLNSFSLDTGLKVNKGEVMLIYQATEKQGLFQKPKTDRKIKILLFYTDLQTLEIAK